MQIQSFQGRGRVRVPRWVRGAWGLPESCNYDKYVFVDLLGVGWDVIDFGKPKPPSPSHDKVLVHGL